MPTCLNPIHRSDILSFMPHPKLHQKCRYVSRNFNDTIAMGTEASRLPRRKFRCIDIRVNQMNPERLQRREPRFDHDGYSHDVPSWPTAFIGRQSLWGWHDEDRAKRSSIIDKLGCCWWKKPLSESLAGQILFPAFSPDAEISINVMPCNARMTKGVCLAFRNELSAKTAFSLIHLLHHLKGSATLAANITFDVEGAEESSSLSPAFISILRQQGMKFHAVDGRTGCGQLNEGEMKVLSELAHVGAFRARAWADELLDSGENRDAFFNFILSAGDYCRTLTLEIHHGTRALRHLVDWDQLEAGGGDLFDAIIEKLESGLKRIGCHAISKLILTHSLFSSPMLQEGEKAWPKRCPPKAAIKATEYVVSEEPDSEGSDVDENQEHKAPDLGDDEQMEYDTGEDTDDGIRDDEMAEMIEEAKRFHLDEEMSPDDPNNDPEAGADVPYRVGDDDHDEEDEPEESYRLYEFDFENIYSREPFRVLLKTVPGKADAIDTVEFILR